MNKLVTRINWVNDTDPAINDTHLNQMDSELDAIDDRVIALEGACEAQAENAEAWAVGERGGEAVQSGDPTYENNSKYHAQQAANSATNAGTSATNAGNSATAASNSSTAASNSALVSEGYAKGTQNGTPVTSGSPYYENNAEYFKNRAGQIVGSKVDSFKGRTGAVIPAAGDYDANLINVDRTNTSLPNTVVTVQDYIEYMNPAAITVTLTINGAKEDSITIYDSDNNQVGSCVFNSGQTSGTCQISVPVGGGSYKFVSSVAKGTTEETKTFDYEKTVTLTDTATQTVNIYPDKALYWYGNKVACDYVKIMSGVITHGQTASITDYTNSVSMNSANIGDASLGIMSTSKYTSGTLKGYASQTATSAGATVLSTFPNYDNRTGETEVAMWNSNTAYTNQIISANFSSETYVCLRIYFGLAEFKAFWID